MVKLNYVAARRQQVGKFGNVSGGWVSLNNPVSNMDQSHLLVIKYSSHPSQNLCPALTTDASIGASTWDLGTVWLLPINKSYTTSFYW